MKLHHTQTYTIMSHPKNAVARHLQELAHKLASGPDRMTAADGDGGITTASATVPKDSGKPLVAADMASDGTPRTTTTLSGTPDRMTTKDGDGGITAAPGAVKGDPGLAEVRSTIAPDGEVRKNAGDRMSAIRAAVTNARPQAAIAPVQAIHKAAGDVDAPYLDTSEATLAKIARQILSTDEGMTLAYTLFEKEAGERAASERIVEAIEASHQFDNVEREKSAAANDGMSKAAAIYNTLCQTISEDEAGEIIKIANVHQTALSELDHPMLKQAYAQGMDDAALVEGAEEAQAADPTAPSEDEALPMGGEQLGEEEILALLTEMVQSGEITPEELAAALGAGEETAAPAANPLA